MGRPFLIASACSFFQLQKPAFSLTISIFNLAHFIPKNQAGGALARRVLRLPIFRRRIRFFSALLAS
ncbi:hypothetical protein B4100_2629 [Heyndrickxia coagulans]|nr:hypothetical protein B4100_2629 [Heyndrickxia coagulans]